jgi:ABC-2 type transport system permease protein
MIATLLRVFWISLRRDRVVWVLTFVVPVIFYSVFAIIFGGMGRNATPKVDVAVVDLDRSSFSRSLVEALQKEDSLKVQAAAKPEAGGEPLTREQAEKMVRSGDVSAAIILPEGIGTSFGKFDGDRPSVEILADTSDPVAPQMVGGLLQKVVMTGAPDSFMEAGIEQFARWGGGLTAAQKKAVADWQEQLKKMKEQKNEPGEKADNPGTAGFGLLPVKTVDLLGESKANPMITFYAAATAVMFLLFMAANAAGGAFLEEVENGTLDRLLSSHLTMNQLIIGKWLGIALLGMLQVTVMFIWGSIVFHLELWTVRHLIGFVLMTTATAAAGAALGMVLATAARSRGQLTGISTTVILLMSALGGSMFPRIAMSESLQKIGLVTFNAWALDGYTKVFWREAPIWQLWPQLLVLVSCTLVFLAVSRVLAGRWEAV